MAELTASIHVEGGETIDRVLRELPEAVREEILAAGLTAGGEVIRKAAAENIHSRTGRTAADLRVEVQVAKGDVAGAAAVGGTQHGRTGRAYVLRFLEFGTKAHMIPKRKRGSRGRLKKRPAFGGRVFSRVNHPGIAPQSPLTRALADQTPEVIRVATDTWWTRIVAAVERLRGGA